MDIRDDNMIQIGSKVDLFLGRGPFYRTQLEDMTEDGRLVISTPLHRGVPIILRKNQEIELYFYRDNGRYCIDVSVYDFSISNNVRLIILDILSEPRKQQRRESYRLPILRDVLILRDAYGPFTAYYEKDIDKSLLIKASTENLSETGMAMRTRTEFSNGDKFWARIFIQWPSENSLPITVRCRIVQVQYDHIKAIYRYGVHFIACTEDDRANIAKFVLAEQQRNIRDRRWLIEE